MRIAYVAQSILPSREANSVHVMRMCQAFADNGHDVRLFVPNRDDEGIEGVPDVFKYYGVNPTFSFTKLPFMHPKGSPARNLVSTLAFGSALVARLVAWKPNLVYGRDLCGCWIASRLGIPTIYEAHAPVCHSRLNTFFYNGLLHSRHVRRFVLISKALKRIYVDNEFMDPSRILVAHDGADDLGVSEDNRNNRRFSAGYVGNLYEGRGIHIILELATLLPDWDFHVVGSPPKNDIESFAKKFAQPNLHFHGHIPPKDVHAFRGKMDVLLAPYQTKLDVARGGGNTAGYMSPLKIFEYMASKRAIVCSDLPVLREVLNDRNSHMVSPHKTSSWLSALKSLENKEHRECLASQAYTDFKSQYTWKTRAKRVIEGI